MLLSVERPIVGAFAVHIPRATLLLRSGLVQAVLPASVRTCANGQWGFPRNLGEPVNSSATSRLEPPGDQLQASAAHSSAEERTQRVQPRYRQAEVTKRGGMGDRSQSVLIVPTKLANSPQLEPVEGSETSGHGTVIEEHGECIEIRQPCPRNRNG
jgi:hypothetical protein